VKNGDRIGRQIEEKEETENRGEAKNMENGIENEIKVKNEERKN
jgi:hypothetical protein